MERINVCALNDADWKMAVVDICFLEPHWRVLAVGVTECLQVVRAVGERSTPAPQRLEPSLVVVLVTSESPWGCLWGNSDSLMHFLLGIT